MGQYKRWAVCGIVPGLLTLILVGCLHPHLRVQVVNDSDYPLSAIYLIPYHDAENLQAEAFERARNLLPTDRQGATMALAAGDVLTLDTTFEKRWYILKLRFFDAGEPVEYVWKDPFDFTALPNDALVVFTLEHDYSGNGALPELLVTATY